MKPRLVGLTGYKGSGKDEAASAIMQPNGQYERYAFADPVREVCKIAFGLTWEEMLGNRELKEMILDRYPFESPRRLMQQVGTDLFRALWPDVWIEAMRRTILGNPDTCYVITDMRFPNELDAVKKLGGLTIRIRWPENETTIDPHPSERYVPQLAVDHEIINVTGDLESLHRQMKELCYV